MSSKPISITMGDPAGIGPEIVAKLFAETLSAPCIVVGDVATMRRAVSMLNLSIEVRGVERAQDARCRPGEIDVLVTGASPGPVAFGQIHYLAGSAANAAIQRAIDGALDGSLRAIVTAPINKEALSAAGINHPGHTEILAERAGTTEFAMMLANKELRVLLVTIHCALSEAIRLVTPDSEYRAIRLADQAVRQLGITHPRIAVAGLNPHAGEGGLFGREDLDIIEPAISRAREAGFDVTGPWAADTIFMRARRGEFDVVVAQYHDQGLIPIKYLGLDTGVNITVGLPFVRTSVDHGTAFDIAGQGIADHSSLRHALQTAIDMTGG